MERNFNSRTIVGLTKRAVDAAYVLEAYHNALMNSGMKTKDPQVKAYTRIKDRYHGTLTADERKAAIELADTLIRDEIVYDSRRYIEGALDVDDAQAEMPDIKAIREERELREKEGEQ